MKTAILIIDLINEYANPNGKIYCKNVEFIIPNINRLIDFGRKLGWDIIFINTSLTNIPNNIIVKKWGLQAETGTWNDQIIDNIEYKSSDTIVYKKTYDGFYDSNLLETLNKYKIRNLVITGIHTHICVHATAWSACNIGFNVITLEDCMTASKIENHNSRLAVYKTHIGDLLKLDEFLSIGYKTLES